MHAIHTVYVPAIGDRSARIRATLDVVQVVVQYDPKLDTPTNHIKGVEELLRKIGWTNCKYITGWLPDGSHVHVFLTPQ